MCNKVKPVSTTWSRVGNLCFTADEIDLWRKIRRKSISWVTQ